MPKHLNIACLLYIASRGAMAVLAPLYETGIAKVTSPILMLLFITIVILFMRRASWTWSFMRWIAFSEIAIHALFFPTPEFFGVYTDAARLLVVTIMLVSSVILYSLFRNQETKAWFLKS